MASNEDKKMDVQAADQKKKLAAQASFDEDMDLDGFSELDKLEPAVDAQQHQSSMPSSSHSAQNPSTSTPPNMQNGTVGFAKTKLI
jgi:hypothetical protein